MTMRRRVLLLAPPITCTVLLAGGWLLWPRTAITPENAAKIEVGMTLANVEALLGGPARNESDLPDNFINDAFVMGDVQPFAEKRWASRGRVVIVQFDDSWGVTRHTTSEFDVDRSLFDKFRRWLGL